jgi:hypothetical protein
MKVYCYSIFAVFLLFASSNAFAQNIALNILTQNSGIGKKNEIVFLEISISNTSATKAVTVYKLRPQISFPTALVSIPDTGHILPKGWTIISNKKGVLWLSNGLDNIAENDTRTILIAMKGKETGGPSTITGNLSFSNGTAPGSALGGVLLGDSPADNTSSTTIKVIK